MAHEDDLDTKALFRLKQEVAKVKRRVAQRLIEPEGNPQEEPTNPPTSKGRLYEVFKSMNEWW